jgi:hypothetical protein
VEEEEEEEKKMQLTTLKDEWGERESGVVDFILMNPVPFEPLSTDSPRV